MYPKGECRKNYYIVHLVAVSIQCNSFLNVLTPFCLLPSKEMTIGDCLKFSFTNLHVTMYILADLSRISILIKKHLFIMKMGSFSVLTNHSFSDSIFISLEYSYFHCCQDCKECILIHFFQESWVYHF